MEAYEIWNQIFGCDAISGSFQSHKREGAENRPVLKEKERITYDYDREICHLLLTVSEMFLTYEYFYDGIKL